MMPILHVTHICPPQWWSSRPPPVYSGLEQHLPAVAAPSTPWAQWVSLDFTASPGFQGLLFARFSTLPLFLKTLSRSVSGCRFYSKPPISEEWFVFLFVCLFCKSEKISSSEMEMLWWVAHLYPQQLWLTLSLFPPPGLQARSPGQ